MKKHVLLSVLAFVFSFASVNAYATYSEEFVAKQTSGTIRVEAVIFRKYPGSFGKVETENLCQTSGFDWYSDCTKTVKFEPSAKNPYQDAVAFGIDYIQEAFNKKPEFSKNSDWIVHFFIFYKKPNGLFYELVDTSH